jgi:hypothetical protein
VFSSILSLVSVLLLAVASSLEEPDCLSAKRRLRHCAPAVDTSQTPCKLSKGCLDGICVSSAGEVGRIVRKPAVRIGALASLRFVNLIEEGSKH